ncbi:MAG TPA: hypothetical protein DD414_12685, partial [Lachnospiraceae bacterium]|nr:hypothetical protein [Lachnospiraceae bacterium]
GFRYLGRISYALYLVHFPVIATFGSWFFLTFHEKLGYNLTGIVNLCLISGITVLLSEVMVRWVEPLGRKGEVWIGKIR